MTIENGDPDARVVFELEVQGGWPPVASERVWAFNLGENLYRIDNAPWFARDVAVGDIVRATSADGQSDPVFVELVEPSDHVTVRVICLSAGPLNGDLERALERFTTLGVYGEGADQYGMLALDIEPTAPLAAIISTLRDGESDGSWQFEEGRITPAWEEAGRVKERGWTNVFRRRRSND